MTQAGDLRWRLGDREVWCRWSIEYGDQESEQEAPAVLIAFEMRGWDGLGKPASAESPDSVVLHFRGYERERKIVAATLKQIA